jgi:hypothetical protein
MKYPNIFDVAKELGIKQSPGRPLADGSKMYHCFNGAEHKNNDRKASMQISNDNDGGHFHCHTCGLDGNVIELIKIYNNCDVPAAYQWLENRNFITQKKNEKSYQLRWLPDRKGERFSFWNIKDDNLRLPTQADLQHIKKTINKHLTRESFILAGAKIFEHEHIKAIAFERAGEILINPNNYTDILHVEGRTDLLSLLSIGIHEQYGISSHFNKTSTVDVGNGNHYFMLDDDVSPDILKKRIKIKSPGAKIFTVRLPEKDISDCIAKGATKEDVLIYISFFDKLDIKYESPLKSISAADLYYKKIDPLNFLIDGFLPAGYSMLAGAPKSGKSFLALNMAISVANGQTFANMFDTNKADVIYMALEDSERRLQDRMKKYFSSEDPNNRIIPDNLEFITTNKMPFNELIKVLDDKLTFCPGIKLIILDTLIKISPPKKNNGNSYEEEYSTGATLQELAIKHNVCILGLHHTRKMNDPTNTFAEISGTFGVQAALDTMFVLKRTSEYTHLHCTGRDVDQSTWSMFFDKRYGKWNCLGHTDIVELTENQKKIVEFLKESGSHTAKQLAEVLNLDYSNIHKVLNTLECKGVRKYPNTNKYYVDGSNNN